MNFSTKKSFLRIAQESISKGFLIGACVAFVGVAGSFVLQERFQASADFMISSSQEGQDYYTATRSAEYMSRVLGEVLYSEQFIQSMVETGQVNVGFLPINKKDRLETWSKILTVKKNSELGFMRISLSGKSERDVSRIAQAMIDVLNQKQDMLFGTTGKTVNVRLLSGPIIEENPSVAELVFITIFALLFGFFSVFSYQLVKEEIRSNTDR